MEVCLLWLKHSIVDSTFMLNMAVFMGGLTMVTVIFKKRRYDFNESSSYSNHIVISGFGLSFFSKDSIFVVINIKHMLYILKQSMKMFYSKWYNIVLESSLLTSVKF
jgi:hypothetical protein